MSDAKTTSNQPVSATAAPDIHLFHDLREYLKAWFAYKKQVEKLSLRKFAKRADMSHAFLPFILNGTRALHVEVLEKMIPHMELAPAEANYLRALRTLAESQSEFEKQGAYQAIQNFRTYRKLNPNEFETYRYLSKWYYVTIREMAGLQGFKLDANWIQKRLKTQVPLREIKLALKFLLDHDYIAPLGKGAGFPEGKHVKAVGGVYRLALSEFHKTMLGMAADAFNTVPREQRMFRSYTIGVNQEVYDQVRAIVDEAVEKIRAVTEANESRDRVYHLSFAAFPTAGGGAE
ncbi:MAG: TIGR02147 family protein [Bacteriovoracia bacterium]